MAADGEKTIAGVILAGGSGSRLGGVRKGGLRVGGVALVARAAAVLAPHVRPLMVAIGDEGEPDFGVPEGAVSVPDGRFAGMGPAGGLFAAAGHAAAVLGPSALLVSLAGDTPYAPKDMVRRLREAMDVSCDVAFARVGDQIYGTNALWRVEALLRRGRSADGGKLPPLRGLFDGQKVRTVTFAEDGRGDPFRNVNTPSDLIAFARRGPGHVTF